MKSLKITFSLLLTIICLCVSAVFVCNNNERTGKNKINFQSVEQLCAGLNNETTHIQMGSTKNEILKELGINNTVANTHVASVNHSLTSDEIIELCSENNLVALESENGFDVYRKFQLKQLIVNGKINEYYGAEKVAVCFEDIHILQYKTEQETEQAYNKFKHANVKVSISQLVNTNAYALSNYNSWGAEETNIDLFQDYLNTNGSTEEMVVAVLDTGINTAHEIFENRLLIDGFGKVVGKSYYDSRYTYSGYKFEDDNLDAKGNPKGHGTHVAGIIADLTPDNVKILPIKVLDYQGYGSSSYIIAGLEKIYEEYSEVYNVVCANMSLGGSCDTIAETNELNDLFDEIFIKLRSKGILPVVAAGNERANTKYSWPSGCRETAIVVSALKQTYSGLRFDDGYSNYGDSVDISAPGTEIRSATIGNFSVYADDDCYLTMSGTSMAAPHVSAMVALINLDLNFMRNNPSDVEIEDRLLSMTVDLGVDGFDNKYGYGALCYQDDGGNNIPSFETEEYLVENTSVYYDGNYHNIKVTVKNIQNYRIYYGLTESTCNLTTVFGLPEFKNNTHGDVKVYFKIVAEGMQDIVDYGFLNIKPQPIKIRIANQEVVYGTDFELTEQYTLVSGVVYLTDNLQISLKCSADKFSDVGEYFINATCGNDNYNLTCERGELTIVPRPITVQLKEQNNYTVADLEIKQNAYEITAGEIVNEDDLGLMIYIEGNKFSFKKSYTLSACSGNGNYEVKIINAKVNVKFSYLEIVAGIALVVGVVFVVVGLTKKKNKKL